MGFNISLKAKLNSLWNYFEAAINKAALFLAI